MKQAAEHINNISTSMQDASATMSNAQELLQSTLHQPRSTIPKGRRRRRNGYDGDTENVCDRRTGPKPKKALKIHVRLIVLSTSSTLTWSFQALLCHYLTEQKVLTKANQPPPPAADVEIVTAFETEHTGGPVLGSVQMDWAVPFSSPWNEAALLVLAQGFWDLEKGKAFDESEMSINNIKTLCIGKLERTRKEYNDAQASEAMDTEEGVRREGANKSSKASACRRYTRRIGVSFS